MTTCELGEVIEHVRVMSQPESIDPGRLVVGLEDIEANTGILGEPSTSASNSKSTKAAFRRGDILFAKLRPNLRKVVIAPYDGLCTTELLVLRASDEKTAWYLWSILRSDSFVSEVMPLVSGASLPRVPPKELMRVGIPWPDEEARERVAMRAEALHSAQVGARRLLRILNQSDHALGVEAWFSLRSSE